MGNTCKPMAVSFQCMTTSTTNKKKVLVQGCCPCKTFFPHFVWLLDKAPLDWTSHGWATDIRPTVSLKPFMPFTLHFLSTLSWCPFRNTISKYFGSSLSQIFNPMWSIIVFPWETFLSLWIWTGEEVGRMSCFSKNVERPALSPFLPP